MVELPPEKARSFGLGPRTFSKGSAKAQRDSSWTDTPEDRARKAAMAAGGGGEDADTGDSGATDPEVVEYLAGLKRDQEMELEPANQAHLRLLVIMEICVRRVASDLIDYGVQR